MKALIVKEFGPIENVSFEDIQPQQPGRGEVVVDMHAAEANFPDILVMLGQYQVKPQLPFTPGKAGAGIITAIGEGVNNLSVGDRVAVQVEYGAFSEQLRVSADTCYKLPEGMPYNVAAALGLVYQTSHFALMDRGGFKAGDTVLVLGASGGIGSAAVQLSKALGAKQVIGGVLGAENEEIARKIGCDATIDLSMENLRDGLRDKIYEITDNYGVDVVIDPVGGEVTNAALRAVAWRGCLVVIGFAAGEIPTIKANYLLVKNIAVSGLQWSDYRDRDPERVKRVQEEIFSLWSAGKLEPYISQALPLEQFSNALKTLQEGRAQGKIILTSGDDNE